MTTSDATGGELLDANLLIALMVADHVHHEAAEAWALDRDRLVTCAITQGSLVRFLVRAGAAGREVHELLLGLVADERHRFWSEDLGYDAVDLRTVVGHRQVTDAYLAALARRHGGRLATLDRGLVGLHPDVVDLVPS